MMPIYFIMNLTLSCQFEYLTQGFVFLLVFLCSKSEYVIYKLKEMGKIAEKDIQQVCKTFDRLDTGNCGKITLADLMPSHRR